MDLTNPPLLGATDPATVPTGTTPGCFANPPQVGGPRTYSSPDTPGMPEPSDKTAWDFLPDGWSIESHPDGCLGHGRGTEPIRAIAPEGFVPITQLEHCLLYTSPSPRDGLLSRMPSSA